MSVNADVRQRFDLAPMGGVQIAAVAVTVALSALDGYDVLSVTFAAPAIAAEWAIGKAALGVVLSAGLVGMALGSLSLAPLADVVGRRRLVLGSLTLMASGMLLSAFARNLAELSAWRVLTGIGIGAMVGVINALAAEFANARRRSLALSLMAMGYPAGGLIGGLLASFLLRSYGWRAVFEVGAGAAALMLVLVLAFLPEPLAYLLARRPANALQRINRLLVRCRQSAIEDLPAQRKVPARGYRAIFVPTQRAITLQLMTSNLLYVMAVYYVLSWLPQMVTELGFAPSKASAVAALANLCGTAGGVTLGLLANRVGLKRMAVMMMVGLACSTTAFGLVSASLTLVLIAAALCGFFLFGGIAGLYATVGVSFAPEARASGSGFVIGVGRIGSAVAPLLAGWLFAAGFGHGTVSAIFGGAALVAGAVLAGRPRVEAQRIHAIEAQKPTSLMP